MKHKFDSLLSINDFNISKKQANILLYSPLIFTFIMVLLFVFPSTKGFGRWLIKEDHPIEVLTFVIFIFGGVYGILFSRKISKSYKTYIVLFYGVLSICLIILGLEEASWGQRFFHFDTPENWGNLNMQGETTLHNIQGMHGRTEFLRFIFGFSGLCGILLTYNSALKYLKVPLVLISWFVIITLHSLLDILTDIGKLNRYDYEISRFSEVIEFLISISALLYLWLNQRWLTKAN